jgi:uncharacterized membrane-anchored protein YhcB (DUF1043 family)
MLWVWISLAVVVVIGLVVITVRIRSKKSKTPGLDEMERGFSRYRKHIDERTEQIDGKISESEKKIEELNGKAAKIAKERQGDHEKIRDADDWGDLDDLARDIEGRR